MVENGGRKDLTLVLLVEEVSEFHIGCKLFEQVWLELEEQGRVDSVLGNNHLQTFDLLDSLHD